jgi:hypothetical protein
MVEDNPQTLLALPIGITPDKKGEGTTRLLYENVNELKARIAGNTKLHKIMGVIDGMEVDILALNEHKIKFLHKDNKRQGFGKMFHGGEILSRAIGGNIKHHVAASLGRHV